MAYEPLTGWIAVVGDRRRVVPTFHTSRHCAELQLARSIAAAQKRDDTAHGDIRGPISMAEARRFLYLKRCKCGRRSHPTATSDRRWAEVQAGAQGTGRRR